MTNKELINAVVDELSWDPKIDVEEIAVDADNGVVSLRGTVSSFRQRREAVRAAQRVYGVVAVVDELKVRLLTRHRRRDAELRGDALQALTLNGVVPDSIDATVTDGQVKLTGTVEWQYQREEAVHVAGSIIGVTLVIDDITLRRKPHPGAIEESIKNAFQRDARLDAEQLTVRSEDSAVVLSGIVHSWREHDDAIHAAWAAPGVTRVTDRLVVAY